MQIIQKGRLPIKIWAEEVEEGAMQQAINLSNLPFAFKHVALMPDVHQGYGMPIGGVLATLEEMIIPNAVGVISAAGSPRRKRIARRSTKGRSGLSWKKRKEQFPWDSSTIKSRNSGPGLTQRPRSRSFNRNSIRRGTSWRAWAAGTTSAALSREATSASG